MIRGFYTALSGVVAAMTRQAVVADNIANANTVGFKQSRTLQTDYELSIMNAARPRDRAAGNGTVPTGLKLDISQGPLEVTGVQTDLAVEGDGLFVVRTGGGIAYTRAGDFLTDANGMLVTQQGYPVLDTAGHTIQPGSQVHGGRRRHDRRHRTANRPGGLASRRAHPDWARISTPPAAADSRQRARSGRDAGRQQHRHGYGA
jgi:flagellar hook-basal body protein